MVGWGRDCHAIIQYGIVPVPRVIRTIVTVPVRVIRTIVTVPVPRVIRTIL
jgi:hypothetical protein